MLETCKRGKLSDVRDKASLFMLLDTGMRLAEFLARNMEDVDPRLILIRSERAENRAMCIWGISHVKCCAGTSRSAKITTRRSGSPSPGNA
jgi:integrase